jgi:RNA methyltransferase, TrmH family
MAANVKSIASRDNPLLVRLRKLAGEPAAYRKLGSLWIEGEHLCSALLQRGGAPQQCVITESAWAQPSLRALAQSAGEVAILPEVLMAGLSALESPAPLGFTLPWAGDTIVQADLPSVVLDRLQDAGNVGTILRTAAAFGIAQVVALKGTAALWSPKVLRAGMGAHFGLRLVEGLEAEALAILDVPLLAASSHAEQVLDQATLPWPCAWVLGHEGQGVSPALLARCQQQLRIPQPGGEESLNVASAAAVCLYESMRQRLKAPSPAMFKR